MRKRLMIINGEHFFAGFIKTVVVLFIGLVLGVAFWTATAPVAKAAREMTPAEMIQSKLPPLKTLGTAAKPEVLSAVCGAVRKWKTDSAQIVRTAVGARKEFAGDIVAEGIRCLGEQPDCNLTGQIVSAGLATHPEGAANIVELALQASPDCREAIEGAAGSGEGDTGTAAQSSNQNAPPGTLGAGAGGGHQECVVCHNQQHNPITLTIDCNALQAHLDHGDSQGPCQVTQPTNP